MRGVRSLKYKRSCDRFERSTDATENSIEDRILVEQAKYRFFWPHIKTLSLSILFSIDFRPRKICQSSCCTYISSLFALCLLKEKENDFVT